MTKQTKSILKTYFDTGDIPTQGQYRDLIDSQLNLAETGTQVAAGTISSSFLEVENDITVLGNITASGNISASGNIFANSVRVSNGFVGTINTVSQPNITSVGTLTGLNVNGNITASGNISASGTIFANDFQSSGGDVSGVTFHDDLNITGSITASGDISSSATVIGNVGTFTTLTNVNTTHVTASGNISASGNIIGATGSFDNGIILTAPNGNKFRFVVNNSGHLSITGSAI